MTSLIVTPDGLWSSVVREWGRGASARCGLCPVGKCTAREDRCHLVVAGRVSQADAPLWSTLGAAR